MWQKLYFTTITNWRQGTRLEIILEGKTRDDWHDVGDVRRGDGQSEHCIDSLVAHKHQKPDCKSKRGIEPNSIDWRLCVTVNSDGIARCIIVEALRGLAFRGSQEQHETTPELQICR
jgi:hypothetical protein